MSAVFEFDDEDLQMLGRENNDHDKSDQQDDDDEPEQESGYSSEVDAAEPTPVPSNERLYEVALDKNYVSSSVKEESIATGAVRHKKVGIDDFEVLMLLGRGA